MIGQKLTRSQRELIEATRQPVRRECEVEIVRISGPVAGASYAARQAERESRLSKAGPRCAALCTTSSYEAVCELVDEAGRDCWDAGKRRTLRRCLEKLSGPEHRAVCLIFDRAGRLPENEQDDLKGLCDAAAYRAGCRIRLIFLLQKVLVKQQQRDERGKLHWITARCWIRSDHLSTRARIWDYSREGMDEILGIVPSEERDQETERQAASA